MPSNSDLDSLSELARVAADKPGWKGFALYLGLRASGLRKDALRALNAFLTDAEAWLYEGRLSFLRWLTSQDGVSPHNSLLMPEPIHRRLICPTVVELLAREPDSGDANYLFALYGCARDADATPAPVNYLRRAIELDPGHQRARKTLIDWLSGAVDYAQHELPWHGYIGSASEDIVALEEAIKLLGGIDQPHWRQDIGAELNQQLEIAKAWNAFEQEGRPGDFATWCAERGGPTLMMRWIGPLH